MLAAYGFSAKKDLLAQLLELNLNVARRIEAGETVVAPGIPADYPQPKKLVSEDCIQPRKMGLFGEALGGRRRLASLRDADDWALLHDG